MWIRPGRIGVDRVRTVTSSRWWFSTATCTPRPGSRPRRQPAMSTATVAARGGSTAAALTRPTRSRAWRFTTAGCTWDPRPTAAADPRSRSLRINRMVAACSATRGAPAGATAARSLMCAASAAWLSTRENCTRARGRRVPGETKPTAAAMKRSLVRVACTVTTGMAAGHPVGVRACGSCTSASTTEVSMG